MKQRTVFWTLSLIAALLMCWTCLEGLLSDSAYSNETENWKVQSAGQDIINLSFIPFYLFTANFTPGRRWYFPLLWAGGTLYFIYTYLIYCFDIHFNHLFIVYCLILCFHFYALVYLVSIYLRKPLFIKTTPRLKKITGMYFILISSLFYFLWLSEIIPASMHGVIPESLEKAGLFTNPVQVLDISFALPGILVSGFLLLRKKAPAVFLAPVVLTFLLLMELTIGGLVLILWQKGLENNPETAWFFFGLAAFNLVLLLMYVKNSFVISAKK